MKQLIAAFLGGVVGALIAAQLFPDFWFIAAPVVGVICAVSVNPKPVFRWVKGVPAVMRERRARLTRARRAYMYLKHTVAYTIALSLLVYASVALLVDPSFGGLIENPHTSESGRDALAFMWSMLVPVFAFLYVAGVFSEFWLLTDRHPLYSDEELDLKVAEEAAWLARLNPIVLPFWALWTLFLFTIWSLRKMAWMAKEAARLMYNNLLLAGLFGAIFGYLLGVENGMLYPLLGVVLGAAALMGFVLILRLYMLVKD